MKLSIPPFFKKNKRELVFGTIGIVLVLVMILLFSNTINFLVSSTNSALEPNVNQESSQRFQLTDLQTLGIIEEEATSSQSATSSTQ